MDKMTFWYHPESESYWKELASKIDDNAGDGQSIEMAEAEWTQAFIKQCLEKRELPEGVNAILLNAVQEKIGVLYGDCHLYPHFKDGFKIHTTTIVQINPGGFYHTAGGKVYLVQLADQETTNG